MTADQADSPRTAARTMPPSQRAVSTSAGIKIGLVAALFVGLFFRWLWTQHQHSAGKIEDWGHAYVIPLISMYLLWQHRDQLRSIQPSTFWPGLAPMLLGVMCYFFFIAGVGNHMLQGFSMILTLAGLCLLLLGPRFFQFLFVPIAYLVFAVTISEQVMTKVTFPLQLLASQGAYFILSIIGAVGGFLVDVNGNILIVDGKELNVAEACSGMRMVIGFVALAGAVALLSCRHWWQRSVLFLLSVPVALFMNVIRVSVLGLVTMWNPTLIKGDAHMLIGMLLLVLGLFLFMAIVWALNKAVEEQPITAQAVKTGGRA